MPICKSSALTSAWTLMSKKRGHQSGRALAFKMDIKIHKVALVVDPNYGEKILPIADCMHVWVVYSKENMHAIDIWYKKRVDNHLFFQKGASNFEYNPSQSPEEIAASIIETINDHHGPDWSEEISQIPEWTYIEIYGCELKDPIKSTLEEYGINCFEVTEYGFIGREQKNIS